MSETSSPEILERQFNQKIVADYLALGSVDAVFNKHNWDLPISYSGFHRLIRRWGVVKSAGPNTKFSETVAFLEMLSANKLPIEKAYKKLPPSFKTSAQTLYRVVSNVKRGLVRRVGTALVITTLDDENSLLVGKDVSAPRLDFGKPYGSYSLPMGFSKKNESRQTSILRILQREVFSTRAVARDFPYEVIPVNPSPFMHLLIADVAVSVYHLQIPTKTLDSADSQVLTDLQMQPADQILAQAKNSIYYRSGVAEIVNAFTNGELKAQPILEISEVNNALNPAYALAE
jgi:ADP-ribose pyrophosphatase YjhB (NUDIX family)